MYCSFCGAAMVQATNYCKRCGTQLGMAKGEDQNKLSGMALESLVWAIVAVFVLGLGVTIGLLAVMKQALNFKSELIMWIALFVILLLMTIEGVFIWLLLGRRRNAKEMVDISRLKEQVIQELGAMKEPGLSDTAPGVAEHTTRTFEPTYSEPKSK